MSGGGAVVEVTQTVTNSTTHTREQGWVAQEADTTAPPVPMHLFRDEFDSPPQTLCADLLEPHVGIKCGAGVFNAGEPLWRPASGGTTHQNPLYGLLNCYAQCTPPLVVLGCPLIAVGYLGCMHWMLEFNGLPQGAVAVEGGEKEFLLDRLAGGWSLSLDTGFGAPGGNVYISHVFQDEYYAKHKPIYGPVTAERTQTLGVEARMTMYQKIEWRGERMRLSGGGKPPQTQKCTLFRGPDGKLFLDNIGSVLERIVWVDGKEVELAVINALGYRIYLKRLGLDRITVMHPYVIDTVTHTQTITNTTNVHHYQPVG